MKDSGVEWVGEIPEGWDVVKIKYVSSLYGRIGWQGLTSNEYQESGPYLITGTDFTNGHINWDTCVHITLKRYEEATQIQIKNDDLLITKDGTIGKVAIVDELDEKASLNSGVLLIRPINSRLYAVKFCYYILLSDIFWKWYESNQTGNSTIKHLYQEKFKEFSYPLPPFPVQYAISSHLDTKCSLIESTIEKEREVIGKLKEYRQAVITEAVTKGIRAGVPMKDSGVEWIGEVPITCSILKFSRVASVCANLVAPNEYLQYKHVAPNNIEKNTGLLLNCQTVEEDGVESDNHLFYSGQILYSKVRPKLNKVIIAPFDGLCSADMYPITTQILTKYLWYYMISNVFTEQIQVSENRVKMPKINKEELAEILIIVPSDTEQQEIADYLDAKCSAIDATIKKRELAIEKLTAYKQSLIYECVTGKREVLA